MIDFQRFRTVEHKCRNHMVVLFGQGFDSPQLHKVKH